ncbi:MAG TPA: PaaI family thioesterase [Chitinispirillaceae bacterium]|nr:PaaI family thioesterase [Chitinispirillaceae bacterium]
MDSTHYKKLENMYLTAPTNQYYNPTIKIGNGTAEVILMIKKEFFHSGGAVHGSVYFKALDDAAYFAVSSMISKYLLVTISFNLHFIRPVSIGMIKAEGKVTQYGKKISFAESVLVDERSRVVAKGSGTFMRSEKLLCEEIGYL